MLNGNVGQLMCSAALIDDRSCITSDMAYIMPPIPPPPPPAPLPCSIFSCGWGGGAWKGPLKGPADRTAEEYRALARWKIPVVWTGDALF